VPVARDAVAGKAAATGLTAEAANQRLHLAMRRLREFEAEGDGLLREQRASERKPIVAFHTNGLVSMIDQRVESRIPEGSMVSAKDFRTKFVTAYRAARERHREEWDAVWTDISRWSGLMIYNAKPSSDEDAVVRTVASQLGLKCYSREPLTFDAVFVKPDAESWEWFPVLVAIEHENARLTFEGEVQKLLSIRCPLKVGITYVLRDTNRRFADLRSGIAKIIENGFNTINAEIVEDAKTEYLFLIGTEVEPRELQWFPLEFRAGDGPRKGQTFELVP
jgi:hypothetical protein